MSLNTSFKRTPTRSYSSQTVKEYLDEQLPIYSLSTVLEEQVRFENNKPTDEVEAYKAWFSQEGLPPFQVKFKKKVTLPAYLTPVKLENLEACEIRYKVYFRAEDVSEVD